MRLRTAFVITALALLASAPAARSESRLVATGFDEGFGLATGDDGSVFVAHGKGVTKFGPDGTAIRSFDISTGARDVALDASGNVYVAEWGGANWLRVRKLNPDFTTLWVNGQFLGGQGVAVANGRVYVTNRDRVEMLDAADGQPAGSSPSLAVTGDRAWMSDVTARGEHVYAATNGRLHALDATGQPLDSTELAQGDFTRLDVGRDGRLRVAFVESTMQVLSAGMVPLGFNSVPSPRGVAEFGEYVYSLMGGTKLIRMHKSFELVPGGGSLATDTGGGGEGGGGGGGGQPPSPNDPLPVLPSLSINGGALFTNDADVRLHVVAPTWTTSVQVANDGGFAPSRTFTRFGGVGWTLAASGAERLPKTVYVRLLPSGQILQDDIILDQTDPRLTSATATRSGSRYTLRLKAKDATSGVAALQVVGRKARTSHRYATRLRVKLPAGKVSVRVRDNAGNWSSAKRVK